MRYDLKTFNDDEQNVARLIARIHIEIRRCLELELRRCQIDLTSSQCIVLMKIGSQTHYTAADLAQMLDQDTGAMTRMLDRLEAKGLIERQRSSEDRRLVNLELTEQGKRFAPQLPKAAVNVMNRILADFSEKDVKHLSKLLVRLLESATVCARDAQQ